MKIIWTDNFNREDIAQRLVADNIKYDNEARIMLEALQKTCTVNGPNWYEMKPDDYVLSCGMADMV